MTNGDDVRVAKAPKGAGGQAHAVRLLELTVVLVRQECR